MEHIPKDILVQASQGDMESFEKIYKAACGFVYSVALRITNSKQERIKKQRSEHRKKNRELKDEVSAKRLELKQELEKQTTNKERIDSIVAERKILMGNQLKQRVEGILSIREILIPEQFDKFQQRGKSAGENQRSRVERRLKERKSGARRDFLE